VQKLAILQEIMGQRWKMHFVGSWWVYLFCTCCGLFYLHASKEKNAQDTVLDAFMGQLTQEKEKALSLRDAQQLQIQSQKDPLWVEMTLMHKLGLVPENTVKVYFQGDQQ
jgi:hypothetical protein